MKESPLMKDMVTRATSFLDTANARAVIHQTNSNAVMLLLF